ncbi:MAG: dihydrofolate reductase, partial [Gammaproteobacteria bacterium]
MLRNLTVLFVLLSFFGCGAEQRPPETSPPGTAANAETEAAEFQYETERFADLRILRYRVPGFEELSLREKQLLYYLSEAGYAGREIIYDQKYRYNLAIKRTLEKILRDYPGPRDTPDFEALVVYLKRVWFSNGIHHHYATDKFEPGFSFESFARFVHDTPGDFPVRPGQSVDGFLSELRPVMFDRAVDAKLVNRAAGIDPVSGSAVNFYMNVTRDEVEAFYRAMRDPDDDTPPEYGLNSRLVKVDGVLQEQVWKVGGLYTEALEEVVAWLEKAVTVAGDAAQGEALEKLIAHYRSGSL